MGLDVSAFKFLLHKSNEERFGTTVTLGRQNCHTSLYYLKKAGWKKKYAPNFIEDLCVDLFGSEPEVQSIDNSSYEDATIIHNMNNRFDDEIPKFDTVLDLGTLEHVFNVKQSFINASSLLKTGGRIMHVLPSNNFGGHGFYQYSPELFFSLYSEENGYIETEVYVKSSVSSKTYFRVKKPLNGERAQITSIYPVYVCVSTKKIKEVDQLIVQQSDYVSLWDKSSKNKTKFKNLSKSNISNWDMWPIKYFYRPYVLIKNGLNIFNPHLSRCKF